MHVILVSRWYPPTGHGGIAVYNHYMAHALVKAGHRVTVISSRNSPDVPEKEDDSGVKVYRIWTRHRSWMHRLPLAGRYMRPLKQLLYSKRIAQKLRELEAGDCPDVIEFAEIEAEGFSYLRGRRRSPVVVRCHTPTFILRNYAVPEEKVYDTSLTTAMEKYCIRRADALTTPSHDMAQTIANACDIPVDRFTPIPNALETALFAPEDSPTRKQEEDKLTILHVGRLDRLKGIATLAQAIPRVLREVPHARFIFIGDDRPDGSGSSWRTRLEAYLKEQGVIGQVEFLGKVDQPTLLEWYGRSDIVTVPAIVYESFSYTCAQAMASGLPVVASRIGGIPETVGDGVCGILVEPGNVEELAGALIALARDEDLRKKMGEAGRLKATRNFDTSIVVKKTINLYNSIVKEASLGMGVSHI